MKQNKVLAYLITKKTKPKVVVFDFSGFLLIFTVSSGILEKQNACFFNVVSSISFQIKKENGSIPYSIANAHLIYTEDLKLGFPALWCEHSEKNQKCPAPETR